MSYFEVKKLPPLSFPTLTGSIVTFNSQYAGLPLKSHTVDIDSVNGVSAIHIQNTCGINQWDEVIRNGYYDANNNGVFVAHNNMIANITPIKVMPSTTYYVKSSTYQIVLSYYDAGMYFISQTGAIRNTTFTTPSNCAYVNLSNSWNAGATYNNDISINYPSTDTRYHAFVGQSFTIPIGQTVNEATYNARTGVLEVTQPSVQTLQLPPCPIDTLEGVNNIWADTGDTTLQYVKFG